MNKLNLWLAFILIALSCMACVENSNCDYYDSACIANCKLDKCGTGIESIECLKAFDLNECLAVKIEITTPEQTPEQTPDQTPDQTPGKCASDDMECISSCAAEKCADKSEDGLLFLECMASAVEECGLSGV